MHQQGSISTFVRQEDTKSMSEMTRINGTESSTQWEQLRLMNN